MDEIQKKLEEALNQYYRLRIPGDTNQWCYAGLFHLKNRTYSYVSESTNKRPCVITVRCVKHEYASNNFPNHDFYLKIDWEENKISVTTSLED